jgi:hydroxyacylglutathione hydrolase
MYFDQFYLSCLAHASYMIGSGGVAAVVDPQRDVEIYLQEAARHGLQIKYVIETHLHADFVSGHQELASRTGATIYLGEAAGARFPHHAVQENDEIRFGGCVLRFVQTPGHTLESICILVTDLDRSPEPWAVLTGDTLFIGDVGRPDLSPVHTPQELAGMLYDSLHSKLLRLADSVEVYPAHGAGSMCGRNIGPERRSTIGQERVRNYALQPMTREKFVHLLTAELPPRPGYFALDAELNRLGAPALADLPLLTPMSPEKIEQRLSDSLRPATVLDTRPPVQFGAGHIPGSIHIALGGQFATWAATIVGLSREIILVAEGAPEVDEARTRLARVGIENITGYLEGGIQAWEKSGRKLNEIPQVSAMDLAEQLRRHPGSIEVIDVRRPQEWQGAHIEGSHNLPVDSLAMGAEIGSVGAASALLAGLNPDVPIAVHCKGGYRSSIATSLIERAGGRNVMNLVGGLDAWEAQKLPVVGPPEINISSVTGGQS